MPAIEGTKRTALTDQLFGTDTPDQPMQLLCKDQHQRDCEFGTGDAGASSDGQDFDAAFGACLRIDIAWDELNFCTTTRSAPASSSRRPTVAIQRSMLEHRAIAPAGPPNP